MISGDLEYLMSSLPYLSFQNTPEFQQRVITLMHAYAGQPVEQIGLIQILENEAVKFLSPHDYLLLGTVDLDTIHQISGPGLRNKVLANFADYVLELKEQVSRLRIIRRTAENIPDHQEMIHLEGNPLEEEVQLLKYQWDKLEDLSFEHYANLDALIIYKIKLMLLLRWWGFDNPTGFEKFLALTEDH